MENYSINSSCHSVASSEVKKINSTLVQTSLLQENDDKRDRSDRRRSRLQSSSLTSVPLVVSHEKLKDIYATCIKLSAENKITKQNAFGLQLIDYMQEVLQQIREENGPNFQVASCTLDASVKIYGHRVDSVHLDAFRIAGSLGHGSDTGDPKKPVKETDEIDEEMKNIKPKKSNKNLEKHSQNKIETNLKNIDMDKAELDEASNLWNVVYARRPISSAFGHGGPDAFIINTYHISSDFGEIVIDPLEKALGIDTEHPDYSETLSSELVNIFETDSKMSLLGELDKFSFTSWVPPTKHLNPYKNIIPVLLKNGHESEISGDYSPQTTIHPIMDDGEEPSFAEDHNSVNANLEPDLIEEGAPSRDDLLNSLATQPTEYSYFNNLSPYELIYGKGSLKNPYTNDFLVKVKNNIILPKKTRFKIKKKAFEEDFFDELSVDDKKRLSSKHRRLNQTIPKEDNYSLTTVEPVEDFDTNYLFLLFVNNRACLCNEPMDRLENSRLDPPPDFTVSEGEEDSEVNFDGPEVAAFSNDLNMSLLPQPPIVDRILVKYAKFAKRINTRVVKSSMWKLIDNKEHQTESVSEQPFFIDIHRHLIKFLPKSMASNLSPQLSFVCLLHLANEKHLELCASEQNPFTDIAVKRFLA